ncbi:non-specific serine,threonine protein kinase, partial [Sarracenia purpurea var. burkii]
TWKLREEGKLLEIVDPDLAKYPENEALRFIKVALFCTQAASHQRPDMNQVVAMLSKEVTLNEKLLTEPGVYRAPTSRRLVGGGSTDMTSSSSAKNGKKAVIPSVTSTQSVVYQSVTQMLPR